MVQTDNYLATTNRISVVPKDYFERRQQMVLRELQNARYSIWFAVTGFADKEIFELLIEKAKQGINVEIIIINDNNDTSHDQLNLQEFIDVGGEIFYAGSTYYEKIKHNRFCVIDMKTVIKGIITENTIARKYQANLSIFKGSNAVANHFIRGYFVIKNSFTKNKYRIKTESEQIRNFEGRQSA